MHFYKLKDEKTFQDNLLLIFTGLSRKASVVAKEQISKIGDNKKKYLKLYDIVNEAEEILRNKKNLDQIGELLKYQWKIKKTLSSNITIEKIEKIISVGEKNGAIGAKLLGAGSGGFIVFYARKKNHQKILKSLKKHLHVPFRFDHTGSQIIYYSNNR